MQIGLDPISQAYEAWAQGIAPSVGLPADQIKYLLFLFLNLFWAVLQAYLPRNATVRHLYNAVIGFAYGWILFGFGILHSVILIHVVYLTLPLLPRRSSGRIMTVLVLAYMFGAHVYRAYTDYMGWHLDFTGPQMLLVLKMSMMAFNYADGGAPAAEASKQHSAHQVRHAMHELPTLLELYGWCYSYNGFLAGPAFEFRQYKEWITMHMYEEVGGSEPRSRFLPALWRMAAAVVCAGIYLGGGQRFYIDSLVEPAFRAAPLWWKFVHLHLTCVRMRFQYYFAWKVVEACAILSGIALSKVSDDGKRHEHNGGDMCNVLGAELATNVKGLVDGWNLKVDHYLKDYVYTRCNQTAFKGVSVYLTLFTSAVWHGCYPGYFLGFLFAAVVIEIARMGRRLFRKYFVTADGKPLPTKPLYDVFTFLCTSAVFNYVMSPFPLLSWERSIGLWRSFHFAGHWILLAAFIVFKLMGGSKPSGHRPTPALAKSPVSGGGIAARTRARTPKKAD